MKLVLKAYKFAFPNDYKDDHSDYFWQDPFKYEVIFGKTQKEAVKKRCTNDEFYSFWELKKSVRTRRFPEKDLYSQDKSDLLIDLTDKQINHLTHSLGIEIRDVCPDDFYRNYSAYYRKNDRCESLVKLGLMENWQKLGSEVYGVTEIGKTAVKTLLLINN